MSDKELPQHASVTEPLEDAAFVIELLEGADLCNLLPPEKTLIAQIRRGIEEKGGERLDADEKWWLEIEEKLADAESGCLAEIKSAVIGEDGSVEIALY